MNYYRFQESVDLKVIGDYPQVQLINTKYEQLTRKNNKILVFDLKDHKVSPKYSSLTFKGLEMKKGKITDIISTILFSNTNFVISPNICEKLEQAYFLDKEQIQILQYPVEINKDGKIIEYGILHIVPLPIEEYIDFENSIFVAHFKELENVGFTDFNDFKNKHESDHRWSTVWGKLVKFKKPLDLDIFSLGKIRQRTYVSEKFKNWFEDNGFTGAEFKYCGNQFEINA